MSFDAWRTVHRAATAIVALVGVAHSVATMALYATWNPDALWFLESGIALVTMAGMNWAHVGLEPCSQPTAKVVRAFNWLYVALAVAALTVVPEPQTYVLGAALAAQAIAGHVTLRG